MYIYIYIYIHIVTYSNNVPGHFAHKRDTRSFIAWQDACSDVSLADSIKWGSIKRPGILASTKKGGKRKNPPFYQNCPRILSKDSLNSRLQFCKKSSLSFKISPLSLRSFLWEELYLLLKEPHMLSKEPYIL